MGNSLEVNVIAFVTLKESQIAKRIDKIKFDVGCIQFKGDDFNEYIRFDKLKSIVIGEESIVIEYQSDLYQAIVRISNSIQIREFDLITQLEKLKSDLKI